MEPTTVAMLLVAGFIFALPWFTKGGRRVLRRNPGAVVLLAVLAVGLGYWGSGYVQPYVEKGQEVSGKCVQGTLILSLKDAYSGAAITSGKVYLAPAETDIEQFTIEASDGSLEYDKVRTLDANGQVSFVLEGCPLGKTYTFGYWPGTVDTTGYPPVIFKVTLYDDLNPEGEFIGVENVQEIWPLAGLTAYDSTLTARSAYTFTATGSDQQLGFKIGPDTQNERSGPAYIYLDVPSGISVDYVKIGGSNAKLIKVADLSSGDPRYEWAPAGYEYVLDVTLPEMKYAVNPDTKDALIQFDSSADATLTMAFVSYGVQVGSFQIIVNTAGTAGWS